MKLPVVGNERPDLCGPCGGQCCLQGPGVYVPLDLHPSEDREAVLAAVRRGIEEKAMRIGRYGKTLYVSPPTVGTTEAFDGRYNAPCGLLTDTGCPLSFEDRPAQCRDLKPSWDAVPAGPSCSTGKSHEDYVSQWRPYQVDLAAIAGTQDLFTPFHKRVLREMEARGLGR